MKNTNQVSWIFLILSVVTVICYFLTCLCELKVLDIAGISITGGFFIIPISYIINDCIVEVYGYERARALLWLTVIVNLIIASILQIISIMPADPHWNGQEHFSFIFDQSLKTSIGALFAYTCATTANAAVLSKLKNSCTHLGFKFRAMASTVVGETVDALVFYPILFYGILSWNEIFYLIFCTALGKCCYEAAVLPITSKLVDYMKRVDGVDMYDKNVSYNPFAFKKVLSDVL